MTEGSVAGLISFISLIGLIVLWFWLRGGEPNGNHDLDLEKERRRGWEQVDLRGVILFGVFLLAMTWPGSVLDRPCELQEQQDVARELDEANGRIWDMEGQLNALERELEGSISREDISYYARDLEYEESLSLLLDLSDRLELIVIYPEDLDDGNIADFMDQDQIEAFLQRWGR